MDSGFNKLEKLIETLIEKNDLLDEELRASEKETERLKNENSELKMMLQTQSARVEALLRKLEETIKANKN